MSWVSNDVGADQDSLFNWDTYGDGFDANGFYSEETPSTPSTDETTEHHSPRHAAYQPDFVSRGFDQFQQSQGIQAQATQLDFSFYNPNVSNAPLVHNSATNFGLEPGAIAAQLDRLAPAPSAVQFGNSQYLQAGIARPTTSMTQPGTTNVTHPSGSITQQNGSMMNASGNLVQPSASIALPSLRPSIQPTNGVSQPSPLTTNGNPIPGFVNLYHKPRNSGGVWYPIKKGDAIRVSTGKGDVGKTIKVVVKALATATVPLNNAQFIFDKDFSLYLKCDGMFMGSYEGFTLKKHQVEFKQQHTVVNLELKLKTVGDLEFHASVKVYNGVVITVSSPTFNTYSHGRGGGARGKRRKTVTSFGEPSTMVDGTPWHCVEGDLRVEGVVRAKEVRQYSDARLKTNIEDLRDALQIITRLQGKSFEWKAGKDPTGEGGRRVLGFIAQEVQQVTPELVVVDKETGYLAVEYTAMIPILIEAIKEHTIQYEIEKQQARAELERLRQVVKQHKENEAIGDAQMEERVSALREELVNIKLSEETGGILAKENLRNELFIVNRMVHHSQLLLRFRLFGRLIARKIAKHHSSQILVFAAYTGVADDQCIKMNIVPHNASSQVALDSFCESFAFKHFNCAAAVALKSNDIALLQGNYTLTLSTDSRLSSIFGVWVHDFRRGVQFFDAAHVTFLWSSQTLITNTQHCTTTLCITKKGVAFVYPKEL